MRINTFNDYLLLCKPRVILLMLITAWVGMYMASPHLIPWYTVFYGTLGIAFGSASAAIINHITDRHIDQKMQRTAQRPLASGKVSLKSAIILSAILGISSWLILSKLVNMLSACLTIFTLIGYAVIYSMYLKRATPQNIVIGGLSGAMPPLLGWTVISNDINPYSLLLVLIIFTWTPPHFWALAIYRVHDYANAKVPMLPVTHGIPFTKLSLLLYNFLLLAVSCLPFVVGIAGYLYLVSAVFLNVIFIYLAIKLYGADTKSTKRLSIATFNFSIIYLLLLFIILLLDYRQGTFI